MMEKESAQLRLSMGANSMVECSISTKPGRRKRARAAVGSAGTAAALGRTAAGRFAGRGGRCPSYQQRIFFESIGAHMAVGSRTTFKKRQKEMARVEKQRDKAARRAQKKESDRPSGPAEVMSLDEATALRSS